MNICLVGYGKSNKSLLKFLIDQAHNITVSNNSPFNEETKKYFKENNVIFEEKHGDLLKNTQLAIMSPGVSPESIAGKIVLENNINYTTEIEYSWSFIKGQNPNSIFIGVTGTNGKTTTTTLINHIIQESDYSSMTCGNIGKPLIELPTNLNFYVVEVSSFQMFWSKKFFPEISIILNLAPDHLNWHRSIEEYYNSKLIMAERTLASGGLVLLNKSIKTNNSSERILFFDKEFIKNNILNYKNISIKIENDFLNMEIYKENTVAAILTTLNLNIPNSIIQEAIKTYSPEKHRLEFCGKINNINFYDDSKATNVHAAYNAYLSFRNKDYIAILSGEPKNEDMSQLIEELNKNSIAVFVCGDMKKEVKKYNYSKKFYFEENLKDIVKKALNFNTKNVVLSPAGASYDLYKNYIERGNDFKKFIKELRE
ncbi:UDP-N-acetylmuramoylalanine--D-glutamate ligase [Tepiditoga spiralis]|uniref:UDP-N-acetylmuramoylalanine--D-glutamate ligase n=1 Tax=Tepiditoga spiralis TaxID=2108365 RepID=A0A7G1G8K7_9BACT|nr:UDP-N-acetylmuramoyl-L-alanine--D-glutamate ligase [Tepiditoga spiralis]BBE30372.1 UDP-N-acetylmuramoylalanine--D-glutamate ligase [Tepiditoga spiralis]